MQKYKEKILPYSSMQDTVADDQWLGLGSTSTDGRIEFDNQATDEINILNARVGIGTSTPVSLLHISGETGYGDALLTLDPGVQYGAPRIDFITDTDGYGMSIEATDSNQAFHFYDKTPSGLSDPLFTITEVGTIGIRQDRPLKLLHIGDNGGLSGEIRLEASNGEFIDMGITTNDDFFITGGNVGIGTTTPAVTLDVNGGFATNIIQINAESGGGEDQYSVTTSDYTIIGNTVNDHLRINLPQVTAATEGQILVIKKFSNSYELRIDPYGSQTIDNSGTFVLYDDMDSIIIQSNDSNWWIIGHYW